MVTISADVLFRMGVAGVLFGLWPVILKYAEVPGLGPMLGVNMTALVVVACAYFFYSDPLTHPSLHIILGASPWIIGAGLCVGFGVVAFLGGLDRATVSGVHAVYVPFVIMLIVQTAVPVVLHLFINGPTLNPWNIAGLVATPLVILALAYKPDA